MYGGFVVSRVSGLLFLDHAKDLIGEVRAKLHPFLYRNKWINQRIHEPTNPKQNHHHDPGCTLCMLHVTSLTWMSCLPTRK